MVFHTGAAKESLAHRDYDPRKGSHQDKRRNRQESTPLVYSQHVVRGERGERIDRDLLNFTISRSNNVSVSGFSHTLTHCLSRSLNFISASTANVSAPIDFFWDFSSARKLAPLSSCASCAAALTLLCHKIINGCT